MPKETIAPLDVDKKMTKFRDGFIGLQIIWEVDGVYDLEFISEDLLRAAFAGKRVGSTGAVTYNRHLHPKSYCYNVELARQTGQITLTYNEDPQEFQGTDYTIIKGTTTILLSDDGFRPEEVLFEPRGEHQFVVEKSMWRFNDKPASLPEFSDSRRKRVVRTALERKGRVRYEQSCSLSTDNDAS